MVKACGGGEPCCMRGSCGSRAPQSADVKEASGHRRNVSDGPLAIPLKRTTYHAAMQPLYVVAFAEMDARDAAWVEALRAAHDPAGHGLLKAHFTFVFGAVGVPLDAVETAVRAAVREMRSIEFCLTQAVSSEHDGQHYVFLCPGRGASEMLELHRKLHTGSLAECLDPRHSFMPHLTVCKTADAAEAQRVLDEVRRDAFQVNGTLTALSVGVVSQGRFEQLLAVALTSAGGA